MPSEPTGDQCTANIAVHETDAEIGYAIWYPQMGGYCGKAVAVIGKQPRNCEGGCVDVYIWHDGEFPFRGSGDDSRPPVVIHHCDPQQFVSFGERLATLSGQNKEGE